MRPEPAPVDDGVEDVRVALERLGRLLSSRQAYNSQARAAGVSLPQQAGMVLRSLYLHGEQPASRLAERSRMDLTAVIRQLAVLEAEGLARRRTDPDDGRVTLASATDEGIAVGRRLVQVGRDHMRRAIGDWSTPKRLRLAGLLTELVDALNATELRATDEDAEPPSAGIGP